MSLHNSLDRNQHLGELNSPLSTAQGVKSPATRKAEARANLGITEVSAEAFGVEGNGVTDNRTKLQLAIDFTSARGGGIVTLGPGTFLTTVANGGAGVGIQMRSGVTLRGSGKGATGIKLANGQNNHLLVAVGVNDAAVMDLELDGNRANQSAGHAFRGEELDGFTMERTLVRDGFGYAIGLEGGTYKRVRFVDVEINGAGLDGFDIKNLEDNNEEMFLRGIIVRNWGITGAQQSAAIDVRGPAILEQIEVREPASVDAVGVRFRFGSAGSASGLGGHKSTLSGYKAWMGANANAIGLNIQTLDTTVQGIYVNGGQYGISTSGRRARIIGATAEGASTAGIFIRTSGSEETGIGDHTVCTSCVTVANVLVGFRTEVAAAQCIGCWSVGNSVGFQTDAAATNTKLIGGGQSGNTTPLTNNGTGTVVHLVDGLAELP